MVIGSYFWGCLADTRGRKTVLIASLTLDGICGLASSISQYFYLFMFFRFLNGFGYVVYSIYHVISVITIIIFLFELFSITGAMGICFPYLGEFQPTKYREKILCWMELFWTFGIIVLPGL